MLPENRAITCAAADADDSAVWSSSWRSDTEDVSVVVLTSATVDSPHGTSGSSLAPPPLDGDRADVLPFRSTGGVSIRSCTGHDIVTVQQLKQWRFYVGARGHRPPYLAQAPKFLDTVVLLLVELIGSIVNFA